MIDKYLNEEITPDEKLDVARQSTNAILQYIGTQKSFQEKQDRGLKYMRWMLLSVLLLLVAYIGDQVYLAINPPPTEVERKVLTQMQESIRLQNDYLSIKEKNLRERETKDSMIAIKNTVDAAINLNATQALAVDRADVAVARLQIADITKNSKLRDSLFNQKKTLNVKTVNANKVDTKSVNIKK